MLGVMTNNMTFLQLAEKILRETNTPMTAIDIWNYAKSQGYDVILGTKGKTPWKTIEAQIYVSIRDKTDSVFIKTGSRPTKFFINGMNSSDLSEVVNPIENQDKTNTSYHERDLHRFLAFYAYTFMKCSTKTVYHEKSSKKSFNQWLHPDMVGVYFPADDWGNEVLDFGNVLGGNIVTLYSFELKKELNFSNIRESYFQTVSNSSWANEGFLVASEILQEEEFLQELKRLNSAFGIGIIKLNLEDLGSSEILFSAKNKPELDWETINKLATENPDFKSFIQRVTKDIRNNEIIKEKYDKIYTLEELELFAKKNKMI